MQFISIQSVILKNFLTHCAIQLVRSINTKNCFYLVGDFNIDISAKQKTKSTETYINYLVSCGSLPIITLPTCVVEKSSTIIDHIVTNDTSHTLNLGVIGCDISYHYQYFAMSPDIPLNLNPKLSFYSEINRNLMLTLIAKN